MELQLGGGWEQDIPNPPPCDYGSLRIGVNEPLRFSNDPCVLQTLTVYQNVVGRFFIIGIDFASQISDIEPPIVK